MSIFETALTNFEIKRSNEDFGQFQKSLVKNKIKNKIKIFQSYRLARIKEFFIFVKSHN